MNPLGIKFDSLPSISDSSNDQRESKMLEDPIIQHALTFNICANRKMNGKIWSSYTYDKQIKIISALVTNACKLFKVSMENFNMYFEKCPTSGVGHLHTVIEASMVDAVRLEKYLNTKHTPKNYTTCLIVPVWNCPNWYLYCKKDQTKIQDLTK